jgi:predicted NUDIX family NTP pyrophosphohydrolase
MKWSRILWLLMIAQFGFAATLHPVPQISQPLVPASIAPGSAAFTLTVNGANFARGAMVQWNGSTRATTFVSSTQLTAQILAADVASAGTALVQVVNGVPGQPISNIVYFPIVLPISQLGFAQTATLKVNGDPGVMTTADMNKDGILDLVLCRELSGKVTVLLGLGGGKFAAPKDFLVQGNCVSLVTGDFNNDHIPDVAVSNEFQVNVLLGKGDGTLARPMTYSVDGTFPIGLVEGDFNGDGNLDLAAANSDTNTVSVLLGNGDGTFQAHVDYAVDPTPNSLTTADFNDDGILDLAVASKTSNEVSILLGAGDGTFGTPVPYNGGINAACVSAADFNGDGKLDLVVSDLNPTTFPISILLGNGDGTFQPRRGYPATGTGTPQIGDMNGDGILDLVLANSNGPVILLGKGDGSFQKGILFPTITANAETIADFNGDGRLDLAVGGYSSGQVPILLQTTVSLAPASIDFGQQMVGTSMMMSATLANFGPTDVTLAKIAVSGPNAKDFKASNTCTKTLTAGSNCTITVTFTPSATGGRSANLTVTDSAPGPQVVTLFGVGT